MYLFNPLIGIAILLYVLYLIYYVFVTYVIPFLIDVVFPIAGSVAITFMIAAFGYSLFVVIKDVVRSIEQVRILRRAAAPVLFQNEARIGYFFGPVSEDVRAFFRDCLSRSSAHIGNATVKIGSAGTFVERMFHRLDWLFASTFGLLTMVFVAAMMAIFGIIAALFLATIFGLLYFVDVAYMAARGVFARCPTCHHKSFHLYYDCPSCSGRPQRHRHLRPNRAGALYHTCSCGAAISSHVLTGRGRNMKAFCTLNEHPIGSALIGTRVTHVAMVGGPDSGKSTLMVGMLSCVIHDMRYRSQGFRLEDPIQQRTIEQWIRDLDRGTYPPKTAAERHRATTVLFDNAPKDRHALYLFDTSGEMFSNSKLMAAHTYFDSSDLILFALDPLSLPSFFELAKTALLSSAIRDASPSRERPVAVASSLVSLMDSNGAKRSNGRFEAPLILVLTKCDLIPEESELTSEVDIEAWINSYGGGELLRLIEANFKTVRFRKVSSLKTSKPGRSEELVRITDEVVAHAQGRSTAR